MIRRATPADAVAIAAVEAAASGPHHAAWSLEALRSTLAAPSTTAWVVAAPDVVAHLLTSTAGDVADVLTVAVHPSRRRTGLARRLLDAAAWADRGVAEVFLEVRSDNDAARGLYRAAGFEVVGQRRRYYGDGTDAVVMRLTVA